MASRLWSILWSSWSTAVTSLCRGFCPSGKTAGFMLAWAA